MALKAKYGDDFNFDVNEAYLNRNLKNQKNPKFVWNKLASRAIEKCLNVEKKKEENIKADKINTKKLFRNESSHEAVANYVDLKAKRSS